MPSAAVPKEVLSSTQVTTISAPTQAQPVQFAQAMQATPMNQPSANASSEAVAVATPMQPTQAMQPQPVQQQPAFAPSMLDSQAVESKIITSQQPAASPGVDMPLLAQIQNTLSQKTSAPAQAAQPVVQTYGGYTPSAAAPAASASAPMVAPAPATFLSSMASRVAESISQASKPAVVPNVKASAPSSEESTTVLLPGMKTASSYSAAPAPSAVSTRTASSYAAAAPSAASPSLITRLFPSLTASSSPAQAVGPNSAGPLVIGGGIKMAIPDAETPQPEGGQEVQAAPAKNNTWLIVALAAAAVVAGYMYVKKGK